MLVKAALHSSKPLSCHLLLNNKPVGTCACVCAVEKGSRSEVMTLVRMSGNRLGCTPNVPGALVSLRTHITRTIITWLTETRSVHTCQALGGMASGLSNHITMPSPGKMRQEYGTLGWADSRYLLDLRARAVSTAACFSSGFSWVQLGKPRFCRAGTPWNNIFFYCEQHPIGWWILSESTFRTERAIEVNLVVADTPLPRVRERCREGGWLCKSRKEPGHLPPCFCSFSQAFLVGA